MRKLAKQHGMVTTIDNSWATPLFQKPITHGIDLVMHSASKYLGGHSDTVAGVVAGSTRNDRADQWPHLFLSRREAIALRGMAAAARSAHADPPAAASYEKRADHRRTAESAWRASSASCIRPIPIIRARRRSAAIRACFPSKLRRTSTCRPSSMRSSCSASASAGAVTKVSLFRRLPRCSRRRMQIRSGASVSAREPIRLHVGLESVEELWADLTNALTKAKR